MTSAKKIWPPTGGVSRILSHEPAIIIQQRRKNKSRSREQRFRNHDQGFGIHQSVKDGRGSMMLDITSQPDSRFPIPLPLIGYAVR